MDYSFYGGLPGQDFEIVYSYKSVEDMNTAFKNGEDLNKVKPGQYVIIDVEDTIKIKTDPDHGKIYRRPYEKSDGIYICRIAGIQGPAAMPFFVEDIEILKEEIEQEGSAIVGYETNADLKLEGYVSPETEGFYDEDKNPIAKINAYSVEFYDDKKGEYAKETVFIDFKAPYYMPSFDVQQIDWFEDIQIEKTVEKSNLAPKLNIQIPGGKPGTQFNGMSIEEIKDEETEEVTGEKLVYSYTEYGTFEEEGEVSHEKTFTEDVDIKWVKKLETTKNDNVLTAIYNDGTTQDIGPIRGLDFKMGDLQTHTYTAVEGEVKPWYECESEQELTIEIEKSILNSDDGIKDIILNAENGVTPVKIIFPAYTDESVDPPITHKRESEVRYYIASGSGEGRTIVEIPLSDQKRELYVTEDPEDSHLSGLIMQGIWLCPVDNAPTGIVEDSAEG